MTSISPAKERAWHEGNQAFKKNASLHVAPSVQLGSVVSNFLRPRGLQPARPPCPSPTPGVYSNSWPLSWWCHPTISSSVFPFSSCPQSFPASGSFPMSQLFISGGILGQGKHFLSNLINIAYIRAQERNHPTYKRMPPGRVNFFFFF